MTTRYDRRRPCSWQTNVTVAPRMWGTKSKDLEVLVATEDQPTSSVDGVCTPNEDVKKEDAKNKDVKKEN